MSDDDLISEAREACADKLFNRTYEAGLMRRLADALEAKTGVRVDMTSAVWVETQLAVQGEHQHEWDPEVTPPRMTCGCDSKAVQQVSGALALVEDVIAIHADRIGTHYEDCYKYHAACLAVAVKHRLGSEGR